jgi:hypothetical protein
VTNWAEKFDRVNKITQTDVNLGNSDTLTITFFKDFATHGGVDSWRCHSEGRHGMELELLCGVNLVRHERR